MALQGALQGGVGWGGCVECVQQRGKVVLRQGGGFVSTGNSRRELHAQGLAYALNRVQARL